jgi:hypothetical protein
MAVTLGARAADSRHRIREELATYRILESIPPQRSRFRLRPHRHLPAPVVVLPIDRAAQNAIVRMVAVAEAFVFGLLVDSTEPRLPADPLVDVLWEHEIESALNWGGRVNTWFRLHQVNIDKAGEYQAFRSFIDARNAIAHGLGSLTWHQLRGKKDVAAGLKAVGIDVRSGRLILTSRAVEECAIRSVAFIRFLDDAAPAATPLRRPVAST